MNEKFSSLFVGDVFVGNEKEYFTWLS